MINNLLTNNNELSLYYLLSQIQYEDWFIKNSIKFILQQIFITMQNYRIEIQLSF